MSRLIIGAASHGIGEAFIAHRRFKRQDEKWIAPTQDELDVRDEGQVECFLAVNGPFDKIVYAAGVNRLQWIPEVTQANMADIFAVNVFGFVTLMGAHERLWPNHIGSAVAVVSDAARVPMRTSVEYCSSKAALAMAIKCMARELAPRWQVNGVAPGIVHDTDMTRYIDDTVPEIRGWSMEQSLAYERSMIPTGRRAFKSEIAEGIDMMLNGPQQMTGVILEIAGGK